MSNFPSNSELDLAPKSDSIVKSQNNERKTPGFQNSFLLDNLKVDESKQIAKQHLVLVRAWITPADNLNKGNFYIHFMTEDEFSIYNEYETANAGFDVICKPKKEFNKQKHQQMIKYEKSKSSASGRFSAMKKYQKIKNDTVLQINPGQRLRDNIERVLRLKSKLIGKPKPLVNSKLKQIFFLGLAIAFFGSICVDAFIFFQQFEKLTDINKLNTLFSGKMSLAMASFYSQKLLWFYDLNKNELINFYQNKVH
jgi:hypothetical protein